MSKQGHIQLPSNWGQKNCFIKVKYHMQTAHQKAHLLYQSEKLHLKTSALPSASLVDHSAAWTVLYNFVISFCTSIYIYILTNNSWPKSEPADTVITGILLPLARMVGLQQKWLLCYQFHVRITFSCSNLHDMTTSVIYNPKSECSCAGVAGNTALVCTTVCISAGKCLMLAHAAFQPRIGRTSRVFTEECQKWKKQTETTL